VKLDKKIIILYISFVLLHFISGQSQSVSSKILKEGNVIVLLRLEDPSLVEKLLGKSALDVIVRNQTKAKAKYLGLLHRSVDGHVQTGEKAFDERIGIEVYAESTAGGHVVAGDKLVKGSKMRLKFKDLDFLAYVENIR